jgi:hypothetical protein
MRTLSCLALACLISTPAFAQSAPTDKVPLTVTRAELQVIGQGLMELPYKTSAPIMNDLQAQLSTADKAAADAAKVRAEPEAPKPEPKPVDPTSK